MFVDTKTGALVYVHVDYLMVIGPAHVVKRIREDLAKELVIKWGSAIGAQQPEKYLGKLWQRTADGGMTVRVEQSYWEKLLSMCRMEHCRGVTTPAECGSVQVDEESPELTQQQAQQYRAAVGKIMWAASERPDLAYVAKESARHLQHPTEKDHQRLTCILKYVQKTKSMQLQLVTKTKETETAQEKKDDVIHVYVDANWASDEQRRSTSGGIVWYRGCVIHYWSRTQPVIALSTCEAELLAVSAGAVEGRHIQNVLAELSRKATIRIYSDSSSARAVVMRRGPGRLRHMEIRHLWLQDEMRAKRIEIRAVPTADNPADMMTKAPGITSLELQSARVGLLPCSSTSERDALGHSNEHVTGSNAWRGP